MLGLDMASSSTVGCVLNSQTSIVPLAFKEVEQDEEYWHNEVDISAVYTNLPYTCNMFATDYVTISTSLNTNTWDCNGKGKSNVLLEYQMDKSPMEATVPWEQMNQMALHQEQIDALRNFQLKLTDQFNEEVVLLQG